MQKRFLTLGAVIGAGALAIWGYQMYSARYPSTEDAYVDANVVRVAPRVTGRIATLNVSNHQRVSNGDLLFSVDPVPFRFAVQQAQAQLELARRQVAQAEAAVTSADAEVHNRQVLLDNANAKVELTAEGKIKVYPAVWPKKPIFPMKASPTRKPTTKAPRPTCRSH